MKFSFDLYLLYLVCNYVLLSNISIGYLEVFLIHCFSIRGYRIAIEQSLEQYILIHFLKSHKEKDALFTFMSLCKKDFTWR